MLLLDPPSAVAGWKEFASPAVFYISRWIYNTDMQIVWWFSRFETTVAAAVITDAAFPLGQRIAFCVFMFLSASFTASSPIWCLTGAVQIPLLIRTTVKRTDARIFTRCDVLLRLHANKAEITALYLSRAWRVATGCVFWNVFYNLNYKIQHNSSLYVVLYTRNLSVYTLYQQRSGCVSSLTITLST